MMDTGMGGLESSRLSCCRRAARFGGSVGGCPAVVGLARGWSWGVLAEAASCSSAPSRLIPKLRVPRGFPVGWGISAHPV